MGSVISVSVREVNWRGPSAGSQQLSRLYNYVFRWEAESIAGTETPNPPTVGDSTAPRDKRLLALLTTVPGAGGRLQNTSGTTQDTERNGKVDTRFVGEGAATGRGGRRSRADCPGLGVSWPTHAHQTLFIYWSKQRLWPPQPPPAPRPPLTHPRYIQHPFFSLSKQAQ